MAARVAINGFGRIGRNVLRAAWNSSKVEIVAINDLADAATLAHLLKYDSVHGIFAPEVRSEKDAILIDGRRIRVTGEKDPAALPWRRLGVDIALEATGRFTDRKDAEKHRSAGAGRVIVSAPGKDADITICMGVNDRDYDSSVHRVISNASCTTNCLAPVAKVLLQHCGIVKGFMNTVHSYTNDQKILDLPHNDLRRGRAAGLSMIPTTTGAAKAATLVLPELAGKLEGMAIRVPTPNVSLIDLVIETERETSAERINAAMKEAAEGPMRGVLAYCEAPLVSKDYTGNPASATIDALSTTVIGGNMAKVLAWYDNEWGYSSRILDLLEKVAED